MSSDGLGHRRPVRGLSPVPGLDRLRPLRWWNLAKVGAMTSAAFGIVSGPMAMLGTMWLDHYLRGTTFLGLELVGAPILGIVLGAIEGAFLGAI
jgi:hypothetical protein